MTKRRRETAAVVERARRQGFRLERLGHGEATWYLTVLDRGVLVCEGYTLDEVEDFLDTAPTEPRS